MAAKTIRLSKQYFHRPYKRIGRAFERDAKNLPKREAAFIWRRARSIMKKGRGRPKSRYGNVKMYGENARKLKPGQKRGRKYGQYYWEKGAYSRPGHPPYWRTEGFNLRFIIFGPVQGPKIKHRRGGPVYAQRVGPKYAPSRRTIPVPQLHEYGGTVRANSKPKTFKDASGKLKFRRNFKQVDGNDVLTYPERPYMRPSAKEGRESAQNKSPNSMKKLLNLGGLKGRRIY